MRAGRGTEAVPALERAISLDETNAGARNALAYLYARSGERLDEALGHADEAIRHAPEGEVGYYHDTRGVILWKLGRRSEALDALREAVRLTPEGDRAARAESYRNLALLLEETGEGEEAERYRARADSLER